MNRIDEIIYKETQKAAYEEQCEQGVFEIRIKKGDKYGFY